MPRPVEISVSDQVRKMSPGVAQTVEAARRLVMAVAPMAKEVAYQTKPPRKASTMWKVARYAVERTNVVGIGTFPTHSTIFFYRGRELDDQSGLLQGSGKNARFITLRTPADAERLAVKRLVRKAFRLEASPKQ